MGPVSHSNSSTNNQPSPFDVFSGLDDTAWLDVLVRSVNEPVIDGVRMPGFPSEETQRNTVGSSGAHALREAFGFFTVVRDEAAALGVTLDRDSRVLDFGCGWGRILRCFLRDCHPDRLCGLDVDPSLVAICVETMPECRFETVNPLPPTALPDASFDVITAYSVFSHLAEHASLAWIRELSRLLVPGGVLVVTTQPREFIEFCRSLRGQEQTFAWHQSLARSFVDTEGAFAAYDRGEFLYAATGGGSVRTPDFYGEALISERYARKHWTPYVRVHRFVDDRRILAQALITTQRA
jgi:2-polyprenyl-3-methyl-5-hydroxy-6-metoxy-1,4-benzoquinol methylase